MTVDFCIRERCKYQIICCIGRTPTLLWYQSEITSLTDKFALNIGVVDHHWMIAGGAGYNAAIDHLTDFPCGFLMMEECRDNDRAWNVVWIPPGQKDAMRRRQCRSPHSWVYRPLAFARTLYQRKVLLVVDRHQKRDPDDPAYSPEDSRCEPWCWHPGVFRKNHPESLKATGNRRWHQRRYACHLSGCLTQVPRGRHRNWQESAWHRFEKFVHFHLKWYVFPTVKQWIV